MPASYRYILDDAVAEYIFLLPLRHREQFKTTFRNLANDPYQRGESIIRDLSGCEIQEKAFGQWIVSFWADHAVKEVRIIGVRRFKNKE